MRHVIGRKTVRAFAANTRVHTIEPAIAEVLGVEEKQMFEQMSKAGAAFGFPRGADMRRQINRDNRVRPIHMEDNVQTIIQRDFLDI